MKLKAVVWTAAVFLTSGWLSVIGIRQGIDSEVTRDYSGLRCPCNDGAVCTLRFSPGKFVLSTNELPKPFRDFFVSEGFNEHSLLLWGHDGAVGVLGFRLDGVVLPVEEFTAMPSWLKRLGSVTALEMALSQYIVPIADHLRLGQRFKTKAEAESVKITEERWQITYRDGDYLVLSGSDMDKALPVLAGLVAEQKALLKELRDRRIGMTGSWFEPSEMGVPWPPSCYR